MAKHRAVSPRERHKTLPFAVERGQWSGGDGALVPDGYCRRVRNMLRRPNRWEQRPQFTYDNLTGVTGLANWNDEATGTTRLFAVSAVAAATPTGYEYVKGSSGETWSSNITGGTVSASSIADSVNYRGQLFYCVGGASYARPHQLRNYNGTTTAVTYLAGVDRDHILPLSVATYKERLFVGGASHTFYNYLDGAANYGYVPTSGWTLTNITAASFAAGSGTLYRITPTNTATATMDLTAAGVAIQLTGGGFSSFGANTARYQASFRNTSATYEVPMTIKLRHAYTWSTGDGPDVGWIVVPTTRNGYCYRCTVAGTTHAATEPTWPTTVGTTVTDNTVTWICEGSDVAGSLAIDLPTQNEQSEFVTYEVTASLSVGLQSSLAPYIAFGNTARPTYTLTPVDFALADGKTDGDPRKRDFHHQLVYGDYALPLLNSNASNGTVKRHDYLLWSEALEPEKVRSENYYRMTEKGGPITALKAVAGKLCVFKRSMVSVFGATGDADLPVLPEGEAKVGFGTLNPKSIDVFEDYAYFVGENEVYRWRPGMDSPEPLCGDAMREEVFARNTTTTTTGNGIAFTNQPANDGIEIVSDNAADTTQTCTIIGTTNGTDTVVVETVTLTGTSAVSTVKTDWGVVLAVKLSASCAGTVTVREASGNATITTLATTVTSKGVETVAAAQQNAFGAQPLIVCSGSGTKQIGIKGTNVAGTTIYDSQALTGTTDVRSNSDFLTITEIYTGDLESNRTATVSAASWVESNASPANRALLSIDQKNREIWIYTQVGKPFCYDIDERAFSTHDAGGDASVSPVGYQICDLIYNPTKGNMYAAFTGAPAGTAGLARLDATVTEAADSFSSSGTSTVYAELWPRPIETQAPRFEITVENLRIQHKVTKSQSGQTTTASVSFDQGITFTKTNQVTLAPISGGEYRPMEIPLYQTGGTLQTRIQHAGNGGAANFNISQIDCDVQVQRGEYNQANPTAGTASL